MSGEDNFNNNGDNLIGNAEGFNEPIGKANGDIFGTSLYLATNYIGDN